MESIKPSDVPEDESKREFLKKGGGLFGMPDSGIVETPDQEDITKSVKANLEGQDNVSEPGDTEDLKSSDVPEDESKREFLKKMGGLFE